MMHFLKVLWGAVLVIVGTFLHSLFMEEAMVVYVILSTLELSLVSVISMIIYDAITGECNPFLIFDLPKLLYFIGKPVIVEKGGEYGIRRGFIVHRYRNWRGWQEEPHYMSWEEIAERMKEIETRKERSMKTKEKVLSKYDLYILSNSHTEEYQEAMKEVQECLWK